MPRVFSFILSLIAFFAAIWIIIPAPAYQIWLFAVAASEWSLWLAAFSLFAIIFNAFTLFSGGGKLLIASLVISFAAFIISLYPLSSVLPLANEYNISLSPAEYFSALKGDNHTGIDFSSHTFAIVGKENLQFDFYKPNVKNENTGAAIIVIHGGSWSAGNRNDFPQWNRWLAANGFSVFDIDYRLAPQPNYLSATGDVKCAVRFIKKHALQFGIQPDRIALFGRSAGAHLALLAAYSADDSRLPPNCLENEQSENVRAVVSFYAPIELLWAFDHPANRFVINGPKTLANFLGGEPRESDEIRARFTLASPTAHVSQNTPPTLLVHGGHDQLVRSENMRFLDEKLNENGIAHKTIFIPYAQHGFDYNFHGWGAQITKPILLEFLRENTK